ncbi:MAG: hypothetical protein Kow0037_27660 [Calditrichia bacterium]
MWTWRKGASNYLWWWTSNRVAVELGEQKVESRKQKAESREQKAESRKQKVAM